VTAARDEYERSVDASARYPSDPRRTADELETLAVETDNESERLMPRLLARVRCCCSPSGARLAAANVRRAELARGGRRGVGQAQGAEDIVSHPHGQGGDVQEAAVGLRRAAGRVYMRNCAFFSAPGLVIKSLILSSALERAERLQP